MEFSTRRWGKSEKLNFNKIIFSRVLEWIIVSLRVFKIFQLKNIKLISSHISDIYFLFQAKFSYIEKFEKLMKSLN